MTGNTPITSISVSNFKGVKHITINPDGKNLVVIAGANGAGKSSLIDAITEIFDPSGTRLTPKPIRDGEKKASAEITTTKARIVRTWTKDDAGTLSAFALDGAKYPSGKAFVLEATGGALFDPSEFVGLTDKEQRAQLLEKVTLPFDLAAIDAAARAAYDERTEVNREVKRLTGLIASLTPPAADLPGTELSAAKLLDEHEAARTHNATLQRAAEMVAQHEREIESIDREVEAAEKRIADLYHARETAISLRQDAMTDATAAEPIDLDVITARLNDVESINAEVRDAKRYNATAAELLAATGESSALTAKLEAIEDTKRDGLKKAEFPVEGMSIDDTGITVKNVPFKQLNSGLQDVIALDLATTDRPELRLVIMKNGDRLDATSLAAVDKIATERGYLVLVERDRDESREIGFTVVDGELAQ